MNNDFRRPVAIVGGVRFPFCRMGTQYNELTIETLLADGLTALVERFGLKGQKIDEVILGTVFYPPSTWNLAREAVLKSGLSPESPALGTQRACATSLDAAISVADKIALGRIECGIAGGAESMSNVALFFRPALSRSIRKAAQGKTMAERLGAWKGLGLGDLKPGAPAAVEPTTGKSMGQHCEMMAKDWKVSRAEQDELALLSHQNGVAAYKRGFYSDLVVPYQGATRDNNLREETSLEKLAKLKPAFDFSGAGTLTAGNSSPLTDGAATVLLASEAWAKERGLPVLAYLVDAQSSAVDFTHEGLLMAPAYATAKLFSRRKWTFADFDVFDIHEAFAAQVVCTLKATESEKFCRERLGLKEPLGSIDRKRLNLAGGSVALGHPFGATGARILATAAKLLNEKGNGKAFISICAGGGMGTVAVIER